MADSEEKSGLIVRELKGLIGDLGKLVKLMAERTAEADVIIARDKANREIANIRERASETQDSLLHYGRTAYKHAREEPVITALTFASFAWIAWRLIQILKK